ncbi:hypothetical protein CVT25_004535 [Psilocybe cyanescens]|uniref:Uncharacterized protein n=1 Tax=Psilocybe cyanescens TaxID=93625 RepID=A0A409VSB1_PSICY|nr:hypothetical protein CVT25_004535 [Psilocybe cyanescens]
MFLWYNRSAFSVLPIIGYALLAILFAYLGVRGYRYIKSKTHTLVSLPKPVSGGSHKSTFALGRSTGWNWRRWTLPRVPSWSKVPEVVVGKAKAVAHSKNLGVELLPTTGLPPPPTAVPIPIASVSMPTPQLVDLSTPATPPLMTGTTFNSYPASPRTPSPPFMPHITTSKPIYPAPTHASYPRPPSPHGLFTTTTQKPHRRSRSLGGVPVRRLSGGTSGLRNAVEMKELSGDHTRGTSREHLLIDFSSSSSSDEDRESIMKISPAASDIGILPPGKGLLPLVDARMVGRHVPLVDLGDEGQFSQVQNVDEDSWRWFNPGVTSNISPLSYGRLGSMDSRPKALHAIPQIEKLVDVDSEQDPETVLGSEPIQVRRVELEIRHHGEQLVDIHPHKDQMNIEETTLVDLHDYSSDGDTSSAPSQAQLVDIEKYSHTLERTQIPPHPLPVQTPILVKATFPHPLESLTRSEIQPVIQQSLSPAVTVETENFVAEQPSLLFEHVDAEHELRDSQREEISPLIEFNLISESQKGSDSMESASPLIIPVEALENQTPSQGGWAWDPLDHSDPWASHIADISSPDSDVFVYTGLDATPKEEQQGQDALVVFDAPPSSASDISTHDVLVFEHETDVLEKSPSASLFATELADEEEGGMPALDLGDVLEKPESQQALSKTNEHASSDEEEDLTPKPTPASLELELPALSSGGVSAVHTPSINLQEDSYADGESLDSEDYPDPELLPLPESPLLLAIDIPDPETPSLAFEKDEPVEKAVPSQTPTPPASPPPISPLRVVNNSNGLESLHPSPQGALKGMPHLRLPPSPQLAVLVGHSPRASSTRLVNDIEDKENAAPTALNARSPKPPVASKVDSIPSMDANASESPRLRRRVLIDVSADADVDTNKAVESDEVVKSEMTFITDLETEPKVVEEAVQHVDEARLSSSLPGSFPDSTPSVVVSTSVSTAVNSDASAATGSTSITIGARLALTSSALTPRPSARAIVRSPFDIALAMQLRPGLGAGADPAWMVRFLMAMFGWLAVVVSGQAEF